MSETGYTLPTAYQNPIGTVNNPSNAIADDSAFASFQTSSDLELINHGFSIPAGATITGIQLKIDAKATSPSGFPGFNFRLSWNNGDDLTIYDSIDLTGVSTETTFYAGGETDTWGRTWSPSDFNDGNFVVWIEGFKALATSVDIDCVYVNVYYTVSSASASLSPSLSPSVSPSLSPSVSPSVSPSAGVSVSPSLSPSLSPSISPSLSPSISSSVSPSASLSPSLSSSVSPSASISASASPSLSSDIQLIADVEHIVTPASGVGFGEYANVRYRGQTFIPSQSRIDAILFYCQYDGGAGNIGFKVHFYNVDQDTHLPTTEIYSFTITTEEYTSNKYNRFVLPASITGLDTETEYCVFFAPWDTDADEYSDYYRDLKWDTNAGYSDGMALVNTAGSWATDSGMDLVFQLFYYENEVGFTPSYTQPTLPGCNASGGWQFNSIDMQVVTKSDGWNPDQTERRAEAGEIYDAGAQYAAIAIPYENYAKYKNFVDDIRSEGLKVYHRSHWNAWEGDNDYTVHLGRQEYLERTYHFIVDHPELFEDGDLFGLCVECNNANDNGNYTFRTPETSGGSFDYSKYNQFLKDQVAYANAAFAAISKSVYTFPISVSLSTINLDGQILDSGDGGNSNGLSDSDFVTYFGGLLTIDHYLSDSYRDTDSYGTKYASDLDKINTAFPNCSIMIGEWGYHTTVAVDDTEQDTVYNDVITNALQEKDYLIGVSYWVQMGSTTASMWTDTGGHIDTGGRDAVARVYSSFTNYNAACTGTSVSLSLSPSISSSVSPSSSLSASVSPSISPAPTLFDSYWESGDHSEWDGTFGAPPPVEANSAYGNSNYGMALYGGSTTGVKIKDIDSAGQYNWYIQVYLRINTAPDSEGNFLYIQKADVGEPTCAYVAITSSRTLRLYNGNGATLIGTSSALELDTWYRIRIRVDGTQSAGSQIFEAYLNDTKFAYSVSQTIQTDSMGRLTCGEDFEDTNHDYDIDALSVNDEYYPNAVEDIVESISPSISPSVSPSASLSPSLSPSISPSLSPSISPSISPSVSPSPSPPSQLNLEVDLWSADFGASVSPSLSASISPSLSASLSPSPSPSLSPSISPSVSPSASLSASVSPSFSPSLSPSASLSPSISASVSSSASLSPSVSPSLSPSASLSPSLSPSLSASISPSVSPSASLSPSVSPSVSPSASISPSPSPSVSPSASISPSPSPATWTEEENRQLQWKNITGVSATWADESDSTTTWDNESGSSSTWTDSSDSTTKWTIIDTEPDT